jgi:hypothetical protein
MRQQFSSSSFYTDRDRRLHNTSFCCLRNIPLETNLHPASIIHHHLIFHTVIIQMPMEDGEWSNHQYRAHRLSLIIIAHRSSIVYRPSFIVRRLSFIIYRSSFIVYRPSSIVHRLSFILLVCRSPKSSIKHRYPVVLFETLIQYIYRC